MEVLLHALRGGNVDTLHIFLHPNFNSVMSRMNPLIASVLIHCSCSWHFTLRCILCFHIQFCERYLSKVGGPLYWRFGVLNDDCTRS